MCNQNIATIASSLILDRVRSFRKNGGDCPRYTYALHNRRAALVNYNMGMAHKNESVWRGKFSPKQLI